ncbi:MAG: hypothetical protein Kow0077_32040 [Anaerolineae bacterium]
MRKPLQSLGLTLAAFVLVMILWQIPALNGLLAPFRYFVTTVHELGHGLAAILSGGSFRAYQVYASGAGVATTASPSPWLVIPAGYVGTALFGAALLYLNNRTGRSRWLSAVLGGGFALMTLLFARNLTSLLAGALTAAVLLLLAWKGAPILNRFVLNVLAMLTGLHAVLDIRGLLGNLNADILARQGRVPNDAYAMAQAVGILPPAGWAILWMLIALALLGVSAYATFRGSLRSRE